MKKTIHQDVYLGAIIILIAVLGFIVTLSMPKDSALFPQIMLVLMIFFSVFIIYVGIKKSKILDNESMKKENVITVEKTKLPLFSFAIVMIYIALINFLGFFVSTSLFVAVFMLFYRIRDWKKILLTIVGLDVFIYLLFVNQLNVMLPTGIFF